MQYGSLQHRTLLLSPVTSTTGCCFCFGPISSFFLELFLHWSPVAYWAPTYLGSSSFIVLSFCLHTVHGVLKARILKWFAIPFCSGPHFVRTLHHDPSVLGGPTQHGSWFYWAVVNMIRLVSFLWLWFTHANYFITNFKILFLLLSHSVVSDSLWHHGLQHARPPCPSPTPGAYPNSCPLSQWCHPTISSSVAPFYSCPQSLPASGSFPTS